MVHTCTVLPRIQSLLVLQQTVLHVRESADTGTCMQEPHSSPSSEPVYFTQPYLGHIPQLQLKLIQLKSTAFVCAYGSHWLGRSSWFGTTAPGQRTANLYDQTAIEEQISPRTAEEQERGLAKLR